MWAMAQNRGFTLVELMMTLLIAAILLGVAVPNFSSLVESNRVTAATNELVGALNAARSEAVRRGRDVVICASDDGADCGAAGGWQDGWIIFGDDNGDGSMTAGESIVRVVSGFSVQLSLTGSQTNLQFGSDGLLRGTGNPSFTVQPASCDGGEEVRQVTVNAVGRVGLQRSSC